MRAQGTSKAYMYIGYTAENVNFPNEKEYDLYSKLFKVQDINSKEYAKILEEHKGKLIAYDKKGNVVS